MAHQNPRIEALLRKYQVFKSESERLSKRRNEFKASSDTEFEMDVWRFRKTVVVDLERAWSGLSVKEKTEVDSLLKASKE